MVMVADILTTKHKVVLVANFYHVRKVTYMKKYANCRKS